MKRILLTFLIFVGGSWGLKANDPWSLSCDSLNAWVDGIFAEDLFEENSVRKQAVDLVEAMRKKGCNGLGDALNLMGIIHFNRNEPIQAKRVLLLADSVLSIRAPESKAYIRSQLWLGLSDIQEHRFESAQLYFEKSVRLSQKINFQKGLLQAYLNLGTANINRGDTITARKYLFEALEVNDQLQNKLWGGYIYLNLARIAFSGQNQDEALRYTQMAEKIWEALQFPKGLYYVHLNYARIALDQKALDKRALHLKKALKYAELDQVIEPHNTYVSLGYYYLIDAPDLEQARFYFEKALKNSQTISENVLVDLTRILLDIYAKEGDINSIQQLNELLIEVYQSRAESARLEARKWQNKEIEFENKIAEIQELQSGQITSELKIQRRNLLLLFLLVLALAFLTAVYFQYKAGRVNTSLLKRIRSQNKELSEQKATVEEQKQRLQELNKMKSRFFTNITHEFRTPLTVISGMADQIKGYDHQAELIQRNSAHLLHLINQILDLSKLENRLMRVDYVLGDIIQYIKFLAESFRPLAIKKGINLIVDAEIDELTMDYDAEKLRQIIFNLLSNAIKFSPPEGEVLIVIRKLPQETDGKPLLLLQVKDSGGGIPEKDLPFIFDRFYQADNQEGRLKGTGIGLALTKELIHLQKGTIEVQSRPSIGTTFSIRLPISQSSSSLHRISAGSVSQAEFPNTSALYSSFPVVTTGKSKEEFPRVLIVEDNPDIRAYLLSCLDDEFQVLEARDGQEGIDIAFTEIPDMIISDIMMPKKDGFELCQTLKADERTLHVPIILLTAKADQESRISGFQKGADAYLAKPFSRQELLAQIRGLLEARLRQVEARNRQLEKLVQEKAAEILEAREQIFRQEKLAFLGQLTAGIAHEIKNPLNFVTNFANVSLEQTQELVEEVERYRSKIDPEDYDLIQEILSDIATNVQLISNNGKRANRIVNSMMDHAQDGHAEKRVVDFNSIVRENVNLAYHGYRARVQTFSADIQLNLDENLPHVLLFEHEMGRVILNILDNALYALHQKANREPTDYTPKVVLATYVKDNWVILEIRDNGPGIPPEVRKRIFNPFFTTKPTGLGHTGLGMSISYDIIVNRHQGKLEVDSKPNIYTVFFISIPLTQ